MVGYPTACFRFTSGTQHRRLALSGSSRLVKFCSKYLATLESEGYSRPERSAFNLPRGYPSRLRSRPLGVRAPSVRAFVTAGTRYSSRTEGLLLYFAAVRAAQGQVRRIRFGRLMRGAGERIRTADRPLTRRMLCQAELHRPAHSGPLRDGTPARVPGFDGAEVAG